MKPLGSVAAVIGAIREDATVEAEAIEGRAAAEIERIRALQASDVVIIPDRERRLDAARRDSQTRLAQEDWEDARDAVALREEWINRALADGHQSLATPEDAATRRDRLGAFVEEGLERLPDGVCEVVVSAADAPLLGPEWRRDVARAGGRGELRVTTGPLDGGCIVRTLDGRTSFDNSYSARAARFQSAWRSALARLYEEAISTTTSPGGTR